MNPQEAIAKGRLAVHTDLNLVGEVSTEFTQRYPRELDAAQRQSWSSLQDCQANSGYQSAQDYANKRARYAEQDTKRLNDMQIELAQMCATKPVDGGPTEGVGLPRAARNPKDIIGSCKAPMTPVPPRVMAEVGVALLEGNLKYGRNNYRVVPIESSVYYDGTQRHLMAFWEGQDIDPDSGLHHLTKAISSLIVWRDAMLHGTCKDDRPPASAEFYTDLNAKAAALVEKHKDKTPRHYYNGRIVDTSFHTCDTRAPDELNERVANAQDRKRV